MRRDWPEEGEIIVATVKRIEGHGAYVTLDEYDNKEGLLHISEISSSWVRNIRNHVRERQKTVLHVLRVSPEKKQIDLSLRRITQDERRKKIEDWKKNRKAETLMRSAAESLKVSDEDLYKKVGSKIVDQYGSLYLGLEAAAKKGMDALVEAGVTKKASRVLAKIAQEKIVIKGVTIHGTIEASSMAPNGVEFIKDALLSTKDVAEEDDAIVGLTSLGAPKYRIEITAADYRVAEAVMNKVIKHVETAWSGHDGKFSYTRD
jgi:translation initiation factor 2 subunit 1